MDENPEKKRAAFTEEEEHADKAKVTSLRGMYRNWFLDYASYVILERAVPDLKDGLKPVQRRILHSMKELEDGRYNKVANIIGNTMKYHPHGDASIGDALVQMGQKELMVDTQGNWGNVLTGDSAAAPRYIEARLSKFALDIAFNPKTTEWSSSYDGRNKEPQHLPVKFPLLLAQGAEGIAVGLSSKILPHNFNELIDASISVLKGDSFEIYPDFLTGGYIDVKAYAAGARGGKVRVRAKVHAEDKKTLVITEIPFGTTTGSLIDSIIAANDKGKIKIRKIEDNTAEKVEIVIHLAPNTNPDQMMDALFAFTNCEVSISTMCCVIDDNNPIFTNVNHLLETSVMHTKNLLNQELEIEKHELQEQHLFSSLEKIFIEERIYRDIEECETWEAVIEAIDKGLEPHKKKFYREITTDDIVRLTEIKIKRISKFDAFKADEVIKQLEEKLEKVQHHLDNLVDYAIDYYKEIKKKYGKGRERKTEIRAFENIEAQTVAIANQRLYVNREEGFAGFGLKKDEFVAECSELDDIIAFRADGTFMVSKVAEKVFMGEDIIHIDVFKKNDDRTIYNMIYRDGKSGISFVKRFFVKGVTRDREYDLAQGNPKTKVLYFTSNPNGEAETVTIYLVPRPKLKKLVFDFDFSELAIKGRSSKGNQLTRYMIRKIKLKDEGKSTLGGVKYWFDDEVHRLFTEERGRFLGEFKADEYLIYFLKNGRFRIVKPDVQIHFGDEILFISKFNEKTVYSAVYTNADKEHYVKRFQAENAVDKWMEFISEEENETLVHFSTEWFPKITIKFNNRKLKNNRDPETIIVHEFIGIKGYKAKGKKLSRYPLSKIEEEEALPFDNESIQEKLGIENAIPVFKPKIESENDEDPPVEDDGQISLTL
ncbi:MAG: DNA topoisomerase IV [Marinilabiliales bacterium]|nr:MAG: DNA topoisomerase IV [Marinilabiliales bacterium]